MNMHGIDVPEQAIADVCRRYHIRRLALFGSVLRNQLRSDSDLDVLVEFEKVPDLYAFGGMALDLEEALDVRVDLFTRSTLKERMVPRVNRELLAI